ncbi:MAG: phenylalanine--tRNA ligase subunit beta [Acidimicrobiales bacterium]|jgi:phenylalanyl-tRNA synthetase beta chain
MKVLLSWLQEFAPDIAGDPVELGETLSGLGLAVEEMTITGQGLEGVVLAKVLELSPHPDADKIQVVQVDAGDGEARQVCCGAFNMSVGDLIPFATIGTVMPNGMEIAQRKMRGQMSNGMCCSASEIGLGDDHDGIMLLTGQTDSALGSPITEALGVTEDVLWDLEVNANRPDAMSVSGVARDLAAKLGVPFAFPEFSYTPSGLAVADEATIEIVDPTLCGRFLARTIHGVKIGTSPRWIQQRLIALGMRPINSVVDISNYVMLELGQPNHTYDLATVPDGHVRVRRANHGEQMTTLDGVERSLIPGDGVIANRDDLAIGLAGVMGGLDTEISDTTTSVLLEMAWWDPPSISRTIKRLNLPSEAGTRYRRGADWGENMPRAIDRFCQLISESGAAVASGTIDASGDTPDRTPLPVRIAKVNGLLGTDLDAQTMSDHLGSIGFHVDGDRGAENLAVTIPTWRWDTETETDIAEEVGRMFGFDNIERTIPRSEIIGHLTDYQKARRSVRSALVGAGCDEIQPMPFLGPGDLAKAGMPEDGVTLANPLVQEESILRTSLMPGHLKAIAYNQSHRSGPVRFFEIGHIFMPPTDNPLLPDEREYLAVCASNSEAPIAVELLGLLDGTLALPNVQLRPSTPAGMHPTRSADVVIAGKVRGHVGEVDPDVCKAFNIDGRVAWLELDLEAVLNGPFGNRKYSPVSKYPSSDIDLAFEVPDSITAANIAGAMRKGGGKQLASVELFDTYRGIGVADGARSLAFRLRFQATDRTMTDDEIGELRAGCINAAQKQKGVTLR